MKQKIMILCLCTALLAGCSSEAPQEEEAVLRSVEVMTVGKDSISSSFSYSGKAAPAKEISVVPMVGGKVQDYYFEVGDTVRENQTLFVVDSQSMQDQLRASEATYRASLLSLENTQKTYENNRILFEEGIIAQTEMDQTTLGYETAKANIEAAEINLEILKKNISDCTVTSPMSGVIVSRSVERGSFASPSAPAYVIMDLSTIKVEVGVSEQTVNAIAVGDTVDVLMTAVSAEPLSGTVATISPASGQSGTYSVQVELNNTEGLIKAGMLAEVSFTREKAEDAIVLPRNTVLNKDDETYVYVVEEGVAKKVLVTTGIETGDSIQITTALPEGTQVVTRGQTYLTDGEQVTILDLSANTQTPDEQEEVLGDTENAADGTKEE